VALLLPSNGISAPSYNAVRQLISVTKPAVFAIKHALKTMLFSTPFIGLLDVFPLLYILCPTAKSEKPGAGGTLPSLAIPTVDSTSALPYFGASSS
jgi:hypothetical protein